MRRFSLAGPTTALLGTSLLRTALLGSALIGTLARAQVGVSASAPTERAVVEAYAAHVHTTYSTIHRRTKALQKAVREFVATPTQTGLERARGAWIAARKEYGKSEVFRFYNGPIDSTKNGVETLVNAWPVDEAYIDAVQGRPDSGLVQDPKRFPNLNGFVLTLANERGGETNVCVGWHAIEFMLWGQDFNVDGPGARSAGDFVDAGHAKRRREYLTAITDLLLEHMDRLVRAWAPGRKGNYRTKFVSEPGAGLRKILTGMVVLSGFELGGERTAVALETKDQEDEHSCFSDCTHLDFLANQAGIQAVFEGSDNRPGIRAFAQERAPKLVRDVSTKLAATARALRAIPVPFDQAIRAADDSPDHRALEAAVTALEAQTHSLAALALALGFEVPLAPGGR